MSLNVDQHEIEKFAKLADEWWDKTGKFKTLHDINPVRLQFVNERAPLAGKKVLDVGCGGGILTEAMALLGADVTGIDLAEASLEVARLHMTESQCDINYQMVSVEELAELQPEAYDVITCLELLEHVPNPASIIEACSRLIKPGGDLFFSTLNRTPKSYLFAIIGAEYIMKLLPQQTHDYKKFIKPSELDGWLRASDLALQEICGLRYNPFSGQCGLNSDVQVNYLVHAKK